MDLMLVKNRRDGQAAPMMDWQGGSGRHYQLSLENLDSFVMHDADVYLIAKGSYVLWVGTAADLVAEPNSRVRFRLALDCATQAFRLDAPADKLASIWDLQDAVPAALAPASAQAA